MAEAGPPTTTQAKPATDGRMELAADLAKGSPAAAAILLLGGMLYSQMGRVEDRIDDMARIMGDRIERLGAQLGDVEKASIRSDASRWTREDQAVYAESVGQRIRAVEDRVTRLEQ